ncbi:MAG TPA: hypothetical protein VGG64_17380 [Pirellulales bacterium]|jgi:hypothetical protein
MAGLDAAIGKAACSLTTAIESLIARKIGVTHGESAAPGLEVEQELKKFATAILNQVKKEGGLQ